MTIHKEAWHMEVASFEKERDLLYRALDEGQMSPEEFSRKMLRYWKIERGKDKSLLDKDESWRIVFTAEWLYANASKITQISNLARAWRDTTQNVDDLYLSPRRISEDMTNGQLSITDIHDALYVLPSIDFIAGSKPGVAYGFDVPWQDERTFEQWFHETLRNLKLLSENIGPYLDALDSGEEFMLRWPSE